MVVSLFVLEAAARDETVTREKMDQRERAALNRECAAETQVGLAQTHFQSSSSFLTAEYSDAAERRERLVLSAGALRKAGDIEVVAWGNYDRAANNWSLVAELSLGTSDEVTQRQAQQNLKNARFSALAAAKRSAERYEAAADIYSGLGGKYTQLSASLSEKAATCRERIASR